MNKLIITTLRTEPDGIEFVSEHYVKVGNIAVGRIYTNLSDKYVALDIYLPGVLLRQGIFSSLEEATVKAQRCIDFWFEKLAGEI